jgi:hypothetical protein
MAHFAKIEDGIVTDVVVIGNEFEADGEAYLNSLGLEGQWIQTSYNGNIRGKFAGIGDGYDAELDEFFKPELIAIEPIPTPILEIEAPVE